MVSSKLMLYIPIFSMAKNLPRNCREKSDWHLIEASEDWKTSLQALRLELVFWGNIHLWMMIIWLPILKLETTIYIYTHIDISLYYRMR